MDSSGRESHISELNRLDFATAAAARKLSPVLKKYRGVMDPRESVLYAVVRMRRDYAIKTIPEVLGR